MLKDSQYSHFLGKSMKKMEKTEGFSLGLIKDSDPKEALINCILERNATLHRTAESCSGIFRNEQREERAYHRRRVLRGAREC